MHLVLVNPRLPGRPDAAPAACLPPLGLAWLATAVDRAGHVVRIVDADAGRLAPEQAAEEALRTGPDVVGVTAPTPLVRQAERIAAAVKRRAPGVVTILGGPHATFLGRAVLAACPAFDAAARGESDLALPRLLAAMARAPIAQVQVPGFVLRRADGSLWDGGPPPVPEYLDELGHPAMDLVPLGRYRTVDAPRVATVSTSRGCPRSCAHCAVPAGAGCMARTRSPLAVAEEVDRLHRGHGVPFIVFVDCSFTRRPGWALDLCDQLDARGLAGRIQWTCRTRPDLVDAPTLARLRRSGCVEVELPVGSATEHGRATLADGLSEPMVATAFQAARRAGLATRALAWINVPGEGLADVARTAALIHRVSPTFLEVAVLEPYPGTPIREESVRRGWTFTEDWSGYGREDAVVLVNPEMAADRTLQVRSRMLRMFYGHPRTLWKLVRLLVARPRRFAAGVRRSLGALRAARRPIVPARAPFVTQ